MLDAAAAIATRDGLDALTIARLCEATHLSIGGLYRYFPSKEAIHLALQERMIIQFGEFWQQCIEKMAAKAAEAKAGDEASALLTIMAAYFAYLDHGANQPVEHRLLHSFVATPSQLLTDELARHVESKLAPLLEGYGGLLQQAVACGAIKTGDATQRVYLIWAILHGLDDFRKRDRILPPALQVAGLAEAHIATLLKGWGAKAESLDTAMRLWSQWRGEPVA
jgi:AcrR family transcriptional regulator